MWILGINIEQATSNQVTNEMGKFFVHHRSSLLFSLKSAQHKARRWKTLFTSQNAQNGARTVYLNIENYARSLCHLAKKRDGNHPNALCAGKKYAIRSLGKMCGKTSSSVFPHR